MWYNQIERTLRREQEMKKHGKKMIAPIVITVIVILYFIAYFGFLIYLIDNIVLKLLSGIIPALLAAVMIYVCIQRIKEIKGGEEDDLDNY